MPDRGWIKTVSLEWISFIGQHRPSVINLWQTGYGSWARVRAGDLIVLKRRGSVEDVIGFGTVYCRFPAFTSYAWKRYGTGNGVADEGEMQAQVASRRTGPSVADPVIGNIIIHDLVLFAKAPFKLSQNSVLPKGHHQWSPFPTNICDVIAAQLAGHIDAKELEDANTTFGGGDQSAARTNAWEDGVVTAYRGACAITKIRARDILRVVQIQPFELGGPLDVSNGVLLELNLATLYLERLITFHLNGALLVSPDLVLEDRELCQTISCRPLRLPKDLRDQPASEFVQWRLKEHYRR